jgi:hypothetical protein
LILLGSVFLASFGRRTLKMTTNIQQTPQEKQQLYLEKVGIGSSKLKIKYVQRNLF